MAEHSMPELCSRPKNVLSSTASLVSRGTAARSMEDASTSGDVTESLDRLRGAYDRACSALEGEDSVGEHHSNHTASNSQWGLVQGQVGALSREVTRLHRDLTLLWKEVDSLRHATMQVDSRQTEASRQWSMAQAEVAKESMNLSIQMTEEHERLKKSLDMQNNSITRLVADAVNLQAAIQQEETRNREALKVIADDLREETQQRRVLGSELRQVLSDLTRACEDCTKHDALVCRLNELSAVHDARHSELHESLLASQAESHSKTDNSIRHVHEAVGSVTELYESLERSVADQAAAAVVAREAEEEARRALSASSLERMSGQGVEFRQDVAALRDELRAEAEKRMELSSEFRVEANQHVSDVREVVHDFAKLQLTVQQDAQERVHHGSEVARAMEWVREVEGKVQQSMSAIQTYWQDRPVLAASQRELEETFRRELNHVVVQWEAGEAGLRSLISEKDVRINDLSRDVKRLMDFEQEMRQENKQTSADNKQVSNQLLRMTSPRERLISSVSPSTTTIALSSPISSSVPSNAPSLVSPVPPGTMPGRLTVSTADAVSPKVWPKVPGKLGLGPQRMQSQPTQQMQPPPRVEGANAVAALNAQIQGSTSSVVLPRAASTGNLVARRR